MEFNKDLDNKKQSLKVTVMKLKVATQLFGRAIELSLTC